MARGNRRIAAIAVVALTAVAGSASAASASSFTIKKETQPDGDPTAFTFSYEGVKEDDADVVASGTFTLRDGEFFTKDVTNAHGFYTFREQTPAGWKVVDITCDNDGDPDPDDKPDWNVAEGWAFLQISPENEDKSCTFTNEKLPQPIAPTPVVETPQAEIVPTVVQPPAPRPAPPAIQVAPTRVRSAAARLVGPKRCVSNRYSVAVTGGPVRSVSFWVNGKRVKTVKARTGQRRFSANLPLRSAVARVQARVSFASDARPRSRTLRTTIRRCAPRVVRPQFTG